MTTAAATERPLRADARRNRDRLLEVAVEVFAEHGLDVGVAEIARRAEVGQATLFRHFATKEDLVAAVLDQRIDGMEGAIAAAGDIADPDVAFTTMLRDVVRIQVRDRALVESLIGVVQSFSQPRLEEHMRQVVAGVQAVLDRAQRAGLVRADVIAEDLMALTCGLASAYLPELERPELVERYLGVVLDGLRPGGATPLHPDPATMADLAAVRLAPR
jgi:AcrR family transcriptional regulator